MLAAERSRYGLLASALGAVLLAVSVFLPWYGLSFTANGIALVQQLGDQAAAQYGNASLQGLIAAAHPSLAALSGQQFAALSAHQALSNLNVALLVLAGLALLDALVPLVRAPTLPTGAGGSLVLVGAIASVCVLYRMIDPPAPAGNFISLSLREGAWLALIGSLMMIAGGLWPGAGSTLPNARVEATWRGFSGWTPQS